LDLSNIQSFYFNSIVYRNLIDSYQESCQGPNESFMERKLVLDCKIQLVF